MSRHVDIVTLRLFISVCEERNIARAAARESLVASAVSKRIGAVERDIGTSLLMRGPRGVVPTAAGDAFLRRAREILGTMERMQAELGEFVGGARGSVRVMASVSALAERLPDDIAQFVDRYQSVRVSIDEAVSSDIVRTVREGGADVGVLWDASDLTGLDCVPYRSDRLCVVMRTDHPLAKLEHLFFEQALPHPWIGVAPGGMVALMLGREAARLGVAFTPRIQVSGLDAARRLAAAGLGLAILPTETLHAQIEPSGLVAVPLADEWARREFVICSRPAALVSACSRLLIEHLRERARIDAGSSVGNGTGVFQRSM